MKKIFVIIIIVIGLIVFLDLNGKEKTAKLTAEPEMNKPPAAEELFSVEPDKIFAEPIVFSLYNRSLSDGETKSLYERGH